MLSAGLGAFAFGCILSLYPEGMKYSPPWLMISVFFFPIAFCIQVILKLRGVEVTEGLTMMEERRLLRIVKEKRRQVWIGVGFYFFSAMFTVAVFILPVSHALFFAGYNVIGGLLGIGISVLTYIWKEFEATNDFVNERKRKANKKKAINKSLDEFQED
ncbi:hypothetical protein J7J47_17140 [Halomonas sp. ISL-60]|uniref:hypothetical protein n=1 Tax=Halomonas sp. ISL-56 TaxID=2819149 RepID=UPI001BEB17EA|nr:hypothetical protein [Halomonas sp. ISL-56]MBT2773950.1 hypothetical protein [Halomonas sp. ISL-60]MBT2799897.1 hypothetical protein [Halomonas sp. ISL-56]